MKPIRGRSEDGQILVGVIVMMLILAIIVPVMVTYVQNEARWGLKQARSMTAYQMAEAGVDRGMRKISESTVTWYNGQDGNFPTGYLFNQPYTDLTGGCYAVSISSGPESEQVTIIAVSSDTSKKEGRAVQAIYNNNPLGDTAVRGNSGVTVDGSQTQVEWGAIVTPKSVVVNGRVSPQIWSSGAVDLDTNGSSPPNCDQDNCVQWHSYEPNIPLDPGIDPAYFYNAAIDSGTYYGGDQCWGKNSGTACGVACAMTCSNTTDCNTGKPYYVAGNLCVEGTVYVNGTLFVTGDLTLPNGLAGAGTIDATLPRKAWMQYGLNAASWAHYATTSDNGFPGNAPWDPTAPATFPGLTSSYRSPAGTLVRISKVLVQGFLYVGGNLSQIGGAGQTAVIGAAYVGGIVTVTPNNFFIYYSESAGSYIRTSHIYLTRISWMELPKQKWPPGLACN